MHTLVLVSTFHVKELIFFSEPARSKVTFGRDMESMNLIYYLTLIKKSNMPLVTFQKLNEAYKPLTFAGSIVSC